MSASANIRSRLRLLIDAGSLPSSACSREFIKFIEPLLDAGIVNRERAGAGRSLKVQNGEALQAWFAASFPGGIISGAPARVSAVAQFRDTKALPSDTASVVQARCWDESALQINGASVSAAASTRDFGVFTFLLEPRTTLGLHAPCAAIENPVVFQSYEKFGLLARIPVALYAGGRMSSRVLTWLVSQSAPRFHLTHFPDYDPVGLSEFVRLRNALGMRVTLHLPPPLAEAFRTFGNRKLLRNRPAQSLLADLRSSPLPEVQSVIRLIDDYNCGLEQEALLVDS